MGSFLSMWNVFLLMSSAGCIGDIELLTDRIDFLEKGMGLLDNRISLDKADILKKQDKKILSLKTELKTDVQQHVAETLASILRSESIEDIIKSKVIYEVRHLKLANQHMRRELHKMKTSFEQIQVENRMFRDALKKVERSEGDLVTCSKCPTFELLKGELAERDQITTTHSPSTVFLTTTTQSPSTVSLSTTTQSPSTVSLTTTTLTTQLPSTAASTTTTSTTRQTVTKQPAEMNRILIAPLFSSTKHQFRYVNINNNSLNIYSYFNLKNISSVIHISRLNSLLIGLGDPDKIISSELNSSMLQTVRRNVRTYGMAADEKRGVIFLTTDRPIDTISRMTLQGKNLTTLVTFEGYSGWPSAIAVNPGTRMIFVCNGNNLFSVSYDGSGLTTLDTGFLMFAVTLDVINDVLYYGKWNKVLKKSLASNKTTELTTFGFHIWNVIYYRDRMYYSTYGRTPGIFGEVIVGQDMEASTLQTVEVDGAYSYAICLIP